MSKRKRQVLQFGYTNYEGEHVIWGTVDITGKTEDEIEEIRQQAFEEMYNELSDDDAVYTSEPQKKSVVEDEHIYELKKSIMDMKKQVMELMESNRHLVEVNDSLKRLLKDAYTNGH